MELQGENLNLVKELLEDKIYFHKENITYLSHEVERNTPTEECRFRLSESMQIRHENNKKSLAKASNDRTKCLILLNEVLKSLEVQNNA